MNRSGSILLISCYELGHQPMGLALPLGFLERAGYRPDVLDLSLDPPDRERIAGARIAAISVPMHTALRLGVRAAGLIRSLNPDCHVTFFGLYAILNAEYLLEGPADSVLGGECEEALVALARFVEEGGGNPPEGVRFRKGIQSESAPRSTEQIPQAAPGLRHLTFPVPSRSRLRPLSDYAALEIGDERRVAGYTEASRGCLHLCRHCPIPPVYQGRFFVVPREIVLEDIRSQVKSGGAHVTFGDPDFLNGPGHSIAILRSMHREFPALTFDFTAKIEHLLKHRSLLPELANLGCLFIVSAVESLSERVLAILEKGHTRADVLEAIPLARRAGITLRPTLLPFTPWSTLEDYRMLLDFVEEEDLVDAVDPVQFAVRLLVPPGSRLLDHPEVRRFLGSLVAADFSYRWSHPDPRMDRLHRLVTAVVEKASRDREDAWVTLQTIRRELEEVARDAGDLEIPGNIARPSGMIPDRSPGRRLPRLTESWFC